MCVKCDEQEVLKKVWKVSGKETKLSGRWISQFNRSTELLILLGNLLLASGAFNVILVGGRALHLVSLTSNLDNSLNTLLNFSTTIALQSVCSPLILFVLENVFFSGVWIFHFNVYSNTPNSMTPMQVNHWHSLKNYLHTGKTMC